MGDDTLDKIAEKIGEVVDEQSEDINREEPDEGPESSSDMDKRNMEDYDGGW